MKRLIKWLDINFEPLFLTIVFCLMTILINIQVILRLFLGSGFAWGEEIAKFMFVWLCFIGISYTSRNNRQISVNYLRNALNIKVQKFVVLVVEIISLVLMVFLLKAAVGNVQSIARFGDNAQSLRISLNVVYVSAVVGYSLTIIRLIQSIVWKLKRFNASKQLFFNENGMYSGGNKICFMPKSYQEEAERLIDENALREEQLGMYKNNKKGVSD